MESIAPAADRKPRATRLAASGVLVAAAAAIVVGWMLAGGGALVGGDGWRVWQDHGRWEVSADGSTIRTERSTGCSEHRVRVVDQSTADRWEVRFEQRSTGQMCELGQCIDAGPGFSCGVELTLDQPIPPGTEVWTSCAESDDAGEWTVPGGAVTTLPPGVTTFCVQDPELSS